MKIYEIFKICQNYENCKNLHKKKCHFYRNTNFERIQFLFLIFLTWENDISFWPEMIKTTCHFHEITPAPYGQKSHVILAKND